MSLGDEQATLRAMAHPIRLRILSLLTGAPMTAAEVARELGITHANASYHLRNLLAGGVIVPAGEERIRGGVAKRYRYEPAHDPGPRSVAERRGMYASAAAELQRRAEAARPGGPSVMADADLWVDPDTWRSIHDRIASAARDLHEAARPPRTPGTIRTSTTVALFEMEPGA